MTSYSAICLSILVQDFDGFTERVQGVGMNTGILWGFFLGKICWILGGMVDCLRGGSPVLKLGFAVLMFLAWMVVEALWDEWVR